MSGRVVQTCCLCEGDSPLFVTYNKNPKPFHVEITPVQPSEPVAHDVAVDFGDRVILTRHQRRKAGIVLVGVKYTERQAIGRNELVSIDGGPPVKFKRTGVYREPRR